MISHNWDELRRFMWDYVGIVRSDFRLSRAERRIKMIHQEIEDFYKKRTITEELIELRNLAIVALLIVRCAIMRKESRGLHYTTDYPEPDDIHYLHDTIIQESFSNLTEVTNNSK